MAKWEHPVEGNAIHLLDIGHTCTCPARHVCQSCQGQDDAINEELVGCLEEWTSHIDRWHDDGSMGEGRRCTNCVQLEAKAHTALKKARP